VFGGKVPVSSLKSYMGHTLGACGALEAWMSIEMMRDGRFAPTVNLTQVDSRCADLDYIVDQVESWIVNISFRTILPLAGSTHRWFFGGAIEAIQSKRNVENPIGLRVFHFIFARSSRTGAQRWKNFLQVY
jgi:hypothetical protein